ncbi:MAG TPA: pitrilysin family protein, partial [Candidatus Elarobacter sp.]
TVFFYKMPAAYLDLALRIESDRMVNATIRPADWATERGAIEQEIRAQESSPIYRVSSKLKAAFFAGTPIATASGGTVPSFERMTAADIAAFYHAWYHPGNATLIVAGDFDPERALALIRERFEPIPTVAVPAHAPIDAAPLTSATIDDTIDFPFGFGVLGYRVPGTDAADYAASQVLAGVFRSGRGGLGDLSASGKELAIVNVVNAFPEIGADFLLAIPGAGGTPQSAQSDLAAVLDDYRTSGVPGELVEAAKTRLLSERAYREASISGLGFAWADALALRRPSPDVTLEALGAVSVDDVNRVLRTYFVPEHRIAFAIAAKPSGTAAKTDPNAGVEHVGYTPTVHQPLPAWAQEALKAPLRAPADESKTVNASLPNGLQYAVRRESTSPTVIVRGLIRTSPMLYEPKGKDGAELILGALMPWGTATYDRKAYEAQFDAIAADAQLGSSFSVKVQAKDFERGVQLLADGLLRPALAAEGFAVVKRAMQQEVAASNKLPAAKAALAQRLAMYAPGDPHRRHATETTVGAVTLDDVKSYHRFAFRPDETTLVVVGDVTPDRVRAALRGAFGDWKAVGKPPSFRYKRPNAKADPAKTVTVKSSTSVQSEVTLTQLFHMSRADADYVPLLLANTMLSGEGTGSLLFEELRTRLGYVYNADSNFHVDPNGAEFSVSFATDPKNVKRANAAIVAIIRRLQTHPLAAVELQRAKALLLAQRVLPLDSYGGLADDLLSGVAEGYAAGGSERWFWTALLRTTPDQVEHALRRVDPERFTRVIVEPDR